MSWIKAPSSKVLHIYESTVGDWHAGRSRRWLEAKCGHRLYDPHLTSYFVSERVEGERVCGHCARIARREALALLARAEGQSITDPTVRRRGGAS